ncbi:uncharacterized protein TNCV_2521941 [Trichonephila clavipes]|nr:uncharacterized protein TNCV_2521941 [Trichonephila clavipes]
MIDLTFINPTTGYVFFITGWPRQPSGQVPANEFDLSYTELSDSSVNVTCEAQGLFPPPILKLYLGSSAGSPPQLMTDAVSHFKPKYSGAYDAYLYRTFSASELAKNGASSVFECSLELPGTNYAKAKRIAYYPGQVGGKLTTLNHSGMQDRKCRSCEQWCKEAEKKNSDSNKLTGQRKKLIKGCSTTGDQN